MIQQKYAQQVKQNGKLYVKRGYPKSEAPFLQTPVLPVKQTF